MAKSSQEAVASAACIFRVTQNFQNRFIDECILNLMRKPSMVSGFGAGVQKLGLEAWDSQKEPKESKHAIIRYWELSNCDCKASLG